MNALMLWIAIAAAALGALFASLYTALTDLSKSALEELAAGRARPAAAARVRAILDDVGGHARAVALPRMVLNLVVVVCVIWWVAGIKGPANVSLWDWLMAAVVTAVVLWVSSVVLPMSVAAHAGERLIYALSPLVRGVYRVEAPLGPMVRFLDEVIRRLSGAERREGGSEIEAELRSVIEEGERAGSLDEAEAKMIEAVVRFKELTVKQVMTPRTEVEALEYTDNLGEVAAFIRRVGHSRIPVYRESLDTVVGVFYVKDLMKWLAGEGKRTDHGFDLKSILRPAIFVPETKTVRELLDELLARKVHIAMVADEYGGTSGLVTIEDIVEEVFGEIKDEYEPAEDEAAAVEVDESARTAEAEGRAYIDDVNDALKALGVSVPEADDYDTLGGFVITTLGRIPEPGETFRHGRIQVTVVESSPTRVLKVRLEVKEEQADDAPPTDGEGQAVEGGQEASPGPERTAASR